MKKTKLLTSLVALGTILSAAGCTKPIILDPASNPAELVENAYIAGNYSVHIEYNFSLTEEKLTNSEYSAAVNGDEEAIEKLNSLLEGTYVEQPSLVINLYFDRGYIYSETFFNDEFCYAGLIKFRACLSEVTVYYSSKYRGGLISFIPYMDTTSWEDVFSSLFSAYEDDLLDHLVYNEEDDSYDFDDRVYDEESFSYKSESATNWFLDLGVDSLRYIPFIFAGSLGDWVNFYENYYHYRTSFDEENQQLTSLYKFKYTGLKGLVNDESIGGYGYVATMGDVSLTIYDIGETDKKDYVTYYDETTGYIC